MQRWRKITSFCLWLLELVCLWLPFELQTLYDTRMGFMRQILYMNQNDPLFLVYWVLGALWLLALGMLGWLHRRYHRYHETTARIQALWLAVLLVGTVVLWYLSTPEAPLYFYNLICVALAILLQLSIGVIWRLKVDKGGDR